MQEIFICLTVFLSLLILSTSRESLNLAEPLSDGETLISAGGIFALGFFTPTNADNNNRYVGIWYHSIPVHSIIWVANRRHPVDGTNGKLTITTNGTLTIRDGSSIIWSSTSSMDVTNPIAQLLDSGNFVVVDGGNLENFVWQSFDYPTDTFIPGMKLGWNLTSGLNRNLTSWSSATDPTPGNYTVTMDLRGVPQLIYWAGSRRVTRSGPWTGADMSALIPYNPSYNRTFAINFVKNKKEVYYTLEVDDKSILTRYVVNHTGFNQRYVWLNKNVQWLQYWYQPQTQCDSYMPCGPNGVCYPDGSPKCRCFPGFLPKSPARWALNDWSGGCTRRSPLGCGDGTDGFETVQQTGLPDTVGARLVAGMNLDDCKVACLRNCSCNGFASADRQKEIGCIFWSGDLSDTQVYSKQGQVFYVRLAAADNGSSSSQSHKSNKATLIGVLCGMLGVVLLVSAVCFMRRKQKRTRGDTSAEVEVSGEKTREDDMELPLFDLEDVVAATNNFDKENKLGEGGFGPVYKGKMKDGHEVAVKRLSRTSIQGIDEFKTEVMLVAKLQHRNLVRLLGCCIQGNERMLIYEYMPNKSLDAFLFDNRRVASLDWAKRFNIILGIARGLLYLHQDSRCRIIHRDLKASNVLLDKDMNPKISDFGLARIFAGDESNTLTRRVVGTYGYMSPEYALNGIFSVKSDIFSFGVLVLEIISGQRNRGVYFSEEGDYLLRKAWTLWEVENSVQLVDASLGLSYSVSQVLTCIKVGLLCVQERPEDRPTVSSVLLMLSNDHKFLPEPNPPRFGDGASENSSAEKNDCFHSVNDVTITALLGR